MSCDGLTVPWVGLYCVIVAFPDRTNLCFVTGHKENWYLVKAIKLKKYPSFVTITFFLSLSLSLHISLISHYHIFLLYTRVIQYRMRRSSKSAFS